jgi:hypothetical protein
MALARQGESLHAVWSKPSHHPRRVVLRVEKDLSPQGAVLERHKPAWVPDETDFT